MKTPPVPFSRAADTVTRRSDVCLELLSTISSFAASHVSGNTLPLLFSALPDRAPPRDAEAERVKYWRTLASLKKLCMQPDLFETLVVRFSTKLDLLCVPSSSSPLRLLLFVPSSSSSSSSLQASFFPLTNDADALIPRLPQIRTRTCRGTLCRNPGPHR